MKSYKFRKFVTGNKYEPLKLVEETITHLATDARTRIHFYKIRGHGKIVKYIYQLETFFQGKWRYVVRYNNFHGKVHKDRFNSRDNRISREYLERMGLYEAMQIADKDIKKNYKQYIEEFKKQGEKNA